MTLRRRIEWVDTDAAGIYHWTAAFRLAEAAEAALHTALGIADRTFGATPRVAVDANFGRSLRFNDAVDVLLSVEALGTSSARYRLEIRGAEGVAVSGSITTCLIDAETGRPSTWPADIRQLLTTAGPQTESC